MQNIFCMYYLKGLFFIIDLQTIKGKEISLNLLSFEFDNLITFS